MTNELLTTRDVAGHLGLSPESVLRRFRAGELPGYRLGSNVLRFRAADVDAYLRARRETNASLNGSMAQSETVGRCAATGDAA